MTDSVDLYHKFLNTLVYTYSAMFFTQTQNFSSLLFFSSKMYSGLLTVIRK